MYILPWTSNLYTHSHTHIHISVYKAHDIYSCFICTVQKQVVLLMKHHRTKIMELLGHSWHIIRLWINSLNSKFYLSLSSYLIYIDVVLFGNYNGIFETVWRKTSSGRGYLHMCLGQELWQATAVHQQPPVQGQDWECQSALCFLPQIPGEWGKGIS